MRPLNITMSYSAIANNGILNSPLSITSIKDNNGRVVKEFIPFSKEVADENEIFILKQGILIYFLPGKITYIFILFSLETNHILQEVNIIYAIDQTCYAFNGSY